MFFGRIGEQICLFLMNMNMKARNEEEERQDVFSRNVVISGVAGTLVGATLFAFAVPTFSRLNPPRNEGQVQVKKTSEVKSYTAPLTQNVASSTEDIRSGFVSAVDKASEAVVGVINIQRDSFFQRKMLKQEPVQVSFIKKANGKAYVVTNHHVVEGANRIEISLSDGKKYQQIS
ncbi:hypothetical protein GCM10020331_020340 [Ectobacillus funiculus]